MKKFLLVVITLFVLLSHGVTVQAQEISNPANQNIFSIIDTETVKIITGEECPASRMGGILGETLNSLESIFSRNYYIEAPLSGITCGTDQQALKEQRMVAYMYAKESQGGDFGLLQMAQNFNNTILRQRTMSGIWFMENQIYALTNLQKASAQNLNEPSSYYPGTGFDLLTPIFSFWSWSVNVVFGFLILFIIIIAFAIIFQSKLGGSEVVQLKNAIPSVALALILVPFSYAISGAAIDVLTLGVNVVHGFLLGPGSPGRDTYLESLADPLTDEICNNTGDPECNRGLYPDDYRISIFRVHEGLNFTKGFIEAANAPGIELDQRLGILNVITGALNLIINIQSPTGVAGPAAWIGTLINLALSFLMFVYSIRIGFTLLGKYIYMVVTPIFSPFMFGVIAIPGSGLKAATTYVKNLLACSLNFVVVYAIFLLVRILSSNAFQSNLPSVQTGSFVPPLFGGLAETLGGFSIGSSSQSIGLASFLFTVIGIGLFFSIPAILKSLDTSLGVTGVIPEFIKTPIAGIKDSFSLATKSLRTIGQTAITSGRVPRDLNRGWVNLRSGFERNILGRPEESTTRSQIVKKSMVEIRRLEDALKDPVNANNPAALLSIQTQLNARKAFLNARVRGGSEDRYAGEDKRSIEIIGNQQEISLVPFVRFLQNTNNNLILVSFSLTVRLIGKGFEFPFNKASVGIRVKSSPIDIYGNIGDVTGTFLEESSFNPTLENAVQLANFEGGTLRFKDFSLPSPVETLNITNAAMKVNQLFGHFISRNNALEVKNKTEVRINMFWAILDVNNVRLYFGSGDNHFGSQIEIKTKDEYEIFVEGNKDVVSESFKFSLIGNFPQKT